MATTPWLALLEIAFPRTWVVRRFPIPRFELLSNVSLDPHEMEPDNAVPRRAPVITNRIPRRRVQRPSRSSFLSRVFRWPISLINLVIWACFFEYLWASMPDIRLFSVGQAGSAQFDPAPVDPIQTVLNLTQDLHQFEQHSMQLVSLTQELGQSRFAMYDLGFELKEAGGDTDRVEEHHRLGDILKQNYGNLIFLRILLVEFVQNTPHYLEVFTETVQEARAQARKTVLWYDFWTRRGADRKIEDILKAYLVKKSRELGILLEHRSEVEKILDHDRNKWKQFTEWRVRNHPDVEEATFGRGRFRKWWGSKKQKDDMDLQDYLDETPYDAICQEVYDMQHLLQNCSEAFEAAFGIVSAATGTYRASDIPDASIAALETLTTKLYWESAPLRAELLRRERGP